MTVEERKLDLFRLAAQLVTNDPTLRTASADARSLEATSTQLRQLLAEIGRRDPKCIEIDSADEATGKGKYVVTGGGRRPFTWHVTAEGVVVVDKPEFAKPQDAVTAAEAPDPYAVPIAAIRAASATPLSTFEADLKVQRLAALAAEDAQLAVMRAARGMPEPEIRTLSTEEIDAYRPPDPYREGLRTLLEKEGR
jgi:hypothetical protein